MLDEWIRNPNALRRSAETGEVPAQIVEQLTNALQLLENDQIAEAFSLVEQSARMGSSDAMAAAGELAERMGLADTARHWIEQAARTGNPESMFIMGNLAYASGDIDTAHLWYVGSTGAGFRSGYAALMRLAQERGDVDAARAWASAGARAEEPGCVSAHARYLSEGERSVAAQDAVVRTAVEPPVATEPESEVFEPPPEIDPPERTPPQGEPRIEQFDPKANAPSVPESALDHLEPEVEPMPPNRLSMVLVALAERTREAIRAYRLNVTIVGLAVVIPAVVAYGRVNNSVAILLMTVLAVAIPATALFLVAATVAMGKLRRFKAAVGPGAGRMEPMMVEAREVVEGLEIPVTAPGLARFVSRLKKSPIDVVEELNLQNEELRGFLEDRAATGDLAAPVPDPQSWLPDRPVPERTVPDLAPEYFEGILAGNLSRGDAYNAYNEEEVVAAVTGAIYTATMGRLQRLGQDEEMDVFERLFDNDELWEPGTPDRMIDWLVHRNPGNEEWLVKLLRGLVQDLSSPSRSGAKSG